MVDRLGGLGSRGVYCFLTRGHSLKLESKLIDPLTKSFINVGLGSYEALHKTLQVGFGL